MEYSYLFYIVAGFISGSILFGRIIPLLFKNIDSEDETVWWFKYFRICSIVNPMERKSRMTFSFQMSWML